MLRKNLSVVLLTFPALEGAPRVPPPLRTEVEIRVQDVADAPLANAQVQVREIGGELKVLHSDARGIVNFTALQSTAVCVRKDGCLPDFFVVTSDQLAKGPISHATHLQVGVPLEIVIHSPEPARDQGIELMLKWVAPGSSDNADALAAFNSEAVFTPHGFELFEHALESLACLEGGARNWARRATTDRTGSVRWVVPANVKAATLYHDNGLPVLRYRLFKDDQLAQEIDCDEFPGYPRIDHDHQGNGTNHEGKRVARLSLSGAARLKLEVDLDSLVDFAGSLSISPREGFLAARSSVEFQTAVENDRMADTILLGQSVLDSRGAFALKKVPWSEGRLVGVYTWIDPAMPNAFCAQLLEAAVQARREQPSLAKTLELQTVVTGKRSLDILFSATDEHDEPIALSKVLAVGKCFRVELRPSSAISFEKSGAQSSLKKSWVIAAPPFDRIHLEGVPVERFLLFVDPIMESAFSEDYGWRDDNEPSNLNGVYMKIFEDGVEPLSASIDLKLRTLRH